MFPAHFMGYNDSRKVCFFFSLCNFFPFVWLWCEYVSVDLPYWDLQPHIKRTHSSQPSLSIFFSLVLFHQCTVHSASFHAWNIHPDPWDVSASLCNKLVLITCFYDHCLQHRSSHSHSSCCTRALHLWPYSPWPSSNTLDLMVLLLSCPWRDPYDFSYQSLLEKGVLSEHLHFKVLQEGPNQQPSHQTQLLAGREAGLCPSQRAGVLGNENELQKDR